MTFAPTFTITNRMTQAITRIERARGFLAAAQLSAYIPALAQFTPYWNAGNNLNKAHVKYLEARLIEEARRVGKVRLENGNTPARPSLSEAAQANMENFLEYILMVLPALRIDCFLAQTRPQLKPATASPANGDDAPLLFELHTPRHGIHATARLEGGEFVVQAGSQSRGMWAGKGTGHTHTEVRSI